MARSEVGNLIDRVQQQLNSSTRLETNWLATSLDTVTTTVTFDDDLVPALRRGSILSIGRELMRVRTVSEGAKTATVRRGWRHTTSQAHATDAEVLINPRFTRADIFEAMLTEIESWAPQLYQVRSYETELTAQDETFELPIEFTGAIGLVGLHRKIGDTDTTVWPEIDFRAVRGDVGTWSQATETGLLVRILPPSTMRGLAGTVHALVAMPFDVTTVEPIEDEDLVLDYGLEASMIEVVELGIKMRLLADAEINRSSRDAQDEPRHSEEVPPGSALGVGQTYRQLHMRRLGDEIRKLQRKWKLSSWR